MRSSSGSCCRALKVEQELGQGGLAGASTPVRMTLQCRRAVNSAGTICILLENSLRYGVNIAREGKQKIRGAVNLSARLCTTGNGASYNCHPWLRLRLGHSSNVTSGAAWCERLKVSSKLFLGAEEKYNYLAPRTATTGTDVNLSRALRRDGTCFPLRALPVGQ
eukprot:1141469-Pelagomonas_calceolata.AAC.7